MFVLRTQLNKIVIFVALKLIVERLKLKTMKAQFETTANAKMQVEYRELTANGTQPTTKDESRRIAETIYSKSGRYTLKTVIYE